MPFAMDVLALELAAAVDRAAQRWPEIAPPARWAAFVRERLAHVAAPPLTAAILDDLFLVCACAHGSAAAQAVFEREHMTRVPRYLARFRLDPQALDDVMQMVRERLFVGGPGGTPKIGTYSAKGPLAAWVRIIAVRVALGLKKGMQEGSPAPEAQLTPASDSSESDYVKLRYRDALTRAIQRAIAQSPEQCVFHRATVWRRIDAARAAVVAATRQIMLEENAVTATEFDSILRTVQSQIDLRLSQIA
jgi:RNA polymerase sigma-70 factor (ECF subfamily)